MESPTETKAHWQREPWDGAGPAPVPAASESARRAGVSQDKGQISVLLFFLQIFEIFFKKPQWEMGREKGPGVIEQGKPIASSAREDRLRGAIASTCPEV